MTGARDFFARETLRNGTEVVVRAVRPDDRERVARAFAGLDRESVYTRYFSYKSELSAAELGQIDAMDFVRDVMLVVTAEVAGAEQVINGIARFEADVLPQNKAMLAVSRKSGLPVREQRDGGVVHVELVLGEPPAAR